MSLISILIPAYNRPKYLKECINSILIQKWFSSDELEIIISDDSTNNENKTMFQKHFHNTQIIYHKNESNLWMVRNWNQLLNLKTGKYFIFLSDDDIFYDTNSLQLLYNEWIKNNLNFIYWLRKIINSRWEEKSRETLVSKGLLHNISPEKILNSALWWFWGILYKSFSNLSYDTQIWLSCDWEFNIRYILSHGNAALLEEYTFCYRKHDNNLSNSKQLIRKSEDKIFKKYSKNYFHYIYIRLKRRFLKKMSPSIIKFLKKIGLFSLVMKIMMKINYDKKNRDNSKSVL